MNRNEEIENLKKKIAFIEKKQVEFGSYIDKLKQEISSLKGKEYSNPAYDPAKAKRRNSGHQLSRLFQVTAYPTIVYLDEEAEVIAPIKGYQKPDQIELYLKMFASDDYKELTTEAAWNAYYLAFKPTFKG